MIDRKDIAMEEYKQVVSEFRELTEIRFKLLALLPLGTGAAAFFVEKQNSLPTVPAIPIFGFVVTLCIAIYNKRNDQYYDELVARAAELERGLGIEHGSFSDRPRFWLKYVFVEVDHRWALGLIYAAAASLWAYLFTAAVVDTAACSKHHLIHIWLEFAVPVAVVLSPWGLRWIEKMKKDALEETVKNLMNRLLGLNDDDAKDRIDSDSKLITAVMSAERLLGINEKKATRRVKCHWDIFVQKRNLPTAGALSDAERDRRAASALLAAVIDQPARWIEDVWSGRR